MRLILLGLLLGLVNAQEQYKKASNCVDLFTYKQTQYTGCTDDHSPGKPWCSFEESYRDGSSRWMFCTKLEIVPAGYYHHKKCVFPFIYKRQEFLTCTKMDSKEYWCSTSANFTGEWKHCPKSQTIIPCCETDLVKLNNYIRGISSTPSEKKQNIKNAFDNKTDTCYVSRSNQRSPSFTIEMKDKIFINSISFRICKSPKSAMSNYDVFTSNNKTIGWEFAYYNTSQIPLESNQLVEIPIMKDARFIKFVVYGYKKVAIKDMYIHGRECQCPHLQKNIHCCDIPQRSITEQAIKFIIKDKSPKSPDANVLMTGQKISRDKCPWTKEGPNYRFSLYFSGKHQIYSVFLTAGPKRKLHYITILALMDNGRYMKCGELKSIEGIPTANIPCKAFTQAIRLVHSYYGTLSFCHVKILGRSLNCKCEKESTVFMDCCKGHVEDLISRNFKSLSVPPAQKGLGLPNMLNGERTLYYKSKNGGLDERITFTLPRISYVEKLVIEAPENKTLGQFKVLYKEDKKKPKDIFTFDKDESKPGHAFDIFIKKNVRQVIVQNLKKGNKWAIARFQIMGKRCICK